MSKVKKYIIIAIIILAVFLVLYIIEMIVIIVSVFSETDNIIQNTTYTATETEIFPTEVEQYRNYVTEYCKSHDIKISDTSNLSDYVDFILAIIYAIKDNADIHLSDNNDIMYSFHLPDDVFKNTEIVNLSTPPTKEESIAKGINAVIELLTTYKVHLSSPKDMKIFAQSYVLGYSYANFCYANNKEYNDESIREYINSIKSDDDNTDDLFQFYYHNFADIVYNTYTKTLNGYLYYPLAYNYYTIDSSDDDGMKFNVILDKANQIGIGVFSAYDGTVVEVGGDYVIIKHNETYSTKYLNMNYVAVSVNDIVSATERIGLTYSSFVFQLFKNGTLVNPESYLQRDTAIEVIQ